MIYYANNTVLFLNFLVTLYLIIKLFSEDSVIYTLPSYVRYIFRGGLVGLCVTQLHTILGDDPTHIHWHELIKDICLLIVMTTITLYLKLRYDE